jgi:hypothetical protein
LIVFFKSSGLSFTFSPSALLRVASHNCFSLICSLWLYPYQTFNSVSLESYH